MSQIFQFDLGLEWFRQSNKYLENLIQISTSNYGNITVHKEEEDQTFEKEFDYSIKSLGL